MSSGVVIDVSAALAYVLREQGGEKVLDWMAGAAISAANWAEVVALRLLSTWGRRS